jgi:hypothetical protein
MHFLDKNPESKSDREGSLGDNLSLGLFSEVERKEKLYDLEYNPKQDKDIDAIWFHTFMPHLVQNYLELTNRKIENVTQLQVVLEEDEGLKKLVAEILPSIKYQSKKETVSFGTDDVNTHLEKVKAWLSNILNEYRSPWVGAIGFLSEGDLAYIKNSKLELKKLVEASQGVNSVVFLSTGARLLYPFFKGLTEDTPYLYGGNVSTSFLQCSRDAKQDERAYISQRVSEIIKEHQPPYLIIDDYVTSEHATHDLIVKLFNDNGISANQIIYFAFIGEGATEDEYISLEDYKDLGINVGTLDTHSGPGFYFNCDTNKGTLKNRSSLYEDRLILSGASSEGRTDIRMSLYYYGKNLAKSLWRRSD